MHNDDVPETVLELVIGILEQNAKTLQQNNQAFQQIFEQIGKINQRLDKLESPDSLDSSDAEFLKGITLKLKTISRSLDKE